MQCFNQVGTYQMAVMTKTVNKPFYVVAESFKFVRLYPLNQEDVPNRFKVCLPLQIIVINLCFPVAW